MKPSFSLLAAPFHQNKDKSREKNLRFFTTISNHFHSLLSLVWTNIKQNSRSFTRVVKANSEKWDFSFLGICILIYSIFAWSYTGFPQLCCLTEQYYSYFIPTWIRDLQQVLISFLALNSPSLGDAYLDRHSSLLHKIKLYKEMFYFCFLSFLKK